jgi:NAD(P)-dependent dehydrogenase (short-subunit alcohol dehydrogenase family)
LGYVQVYRCDCSDPSEVEMAAAQIRRDVGVPDVIINNAGEATY